MSTTVNDAPESVSSTVPSTDPLGGLLSLDALEGLAEERVSPVAFGYIAGGAWDEWTLRENVAAFRRRRLWPLQHAVGRHLRPMAEYQRHVASVT